MRKYFLRLGFGSFILFCLSIISIQQTLAQGPFEDEADPPSRFFIAPDLGLVLGSYTKIEVAPSVGYQLGPRFALGLGGRYEYLRDRTNFIFLEEVETHIYGIRFFSRLTLIKDLSEWVPIGVMMGIFGHAEYELLNLESQFFRSGGFVAGDRFWLDTFLAGIGLSQRTGYATSFNIMVLWDLNNTSSSPYINPIVRFGMQIYLNTGR